MAIKAYKFHSNDEQRQVVMLLLKAREIGRNAAYAQLNRLKHKGAKWSVIDDDSEKVVGEMLDVCGFAWITIPGRGKIVKAFKKLGKQDEIDKFNNVYQLEDDRMIISKAYNKGYNLNLGLNIGRQELSVNEEAVFAASEFLNNAGLECSWNSRID